MKITRRQLRKVIEEAHGLSKDDVNYVKKVAKETEDDELKRILKFIAKSNVKVNVTQDVTKMKKESKMKITRRQLRQVIKEALTRPLRESITDMSEMENLIGDLAGGIADKFGAQMDLLWDEDPSMMRQQGYTDKTQWTRQVGRAEIALEDSLQEIIAKEIKDIEIQLHGGDYYDDRDTVSSMGERDSDNDDEDDYPKVVGYTHPATGQKVMINVQSKDDMDDILDPLLRQYPDLAYSVD